MKLIGLLGNAGVGKDSIAEMIAPVHLVDDGRGGWMDVRGVGAEPTDSRSALRGRAVQIALADPIKEACRQIYDFSIPQLWGPSALRNLGDTRYMRRYPEHAEGWPQRCKRCGQSRDPSILVVSCFDYLTPREALQQLGGEWGRRMWIDTWACLALARGRTLLEMPRIAHPIGAATFTPNYAVEVCDLIVISDVRHLNEVSLLRSLGAQVWKVTRPELDTSSSTYAHGSEREQLECAEAIDALVTARIVNDGTLDGLHLKVIEALGRAEA